MSTTTHTSVSTRDFVPAQPAAAEGLLDPAQPAAAEGLDPRGPQFAAALTSAVLLAVLVLPTPYAVVLLAAQAAVFALGAGLGVQASPYAWLFRHLVRPRLAAPGELEDPRPPRFAQTVGLVFAVAGLAALVAGVTVVGQVAVGFALAAALLNAVFGFCLGCELYLLGKRVTSVSTRR